MSETRTVFDPLELKSVEISNRLVDRLRGKYASGPHLPNGNPEFGWRQFQAPPIQHEAADDLEAKDAEITKLKSQLEEARAALTNIAGASWGWIAPYYEKGPAMTNKALTIDRAEKALALLNGSASNKEGGK